MAYKKGGKARVVSTVTPSAKEATEYCPATKTTPMKSPGQGLQPGGSGVYTGSKNKGKGY